MRHNLRPQNFSEYIGQDKIKNTLQVIIGSAIERKEQLDHILLYGRSGIGKTTLAKIIANEYKANIKYAQGPNIEKKSDVLALIGTLQKGDVIFVDEIHGISKQCQELLYTAIDEGVIDIAIGPEGDSKIMRLQIPKFTLIGATTKLNELSIPFRTRFSIAFKIMSYSYDEMKIIIKNLALRINEEIDEESIEMISFSCRKNPRIANNIFKRVLDFKTDSKEKIITKGIVVKTLDSIGVYKNGLEDIHIEYLKVLSDIFYEKYASLDNISSIIEEPKKNIESYVEPYLIELKLIEKSSRGRKITTDGIKYLTTYNLHNV